MAVRGAEATWQGTLKEGNGVMKLGSGLYEGPFTFASRFEEGKGTNPEELIGAAHAGCYSMFLSALLTQQQHAAHTRPHHRHRPPGRRPGHQQDRADLPRRSCRRGCRKVRRVGGSRQGQLPDLEGAGRGARNRARRPVGGLIILDR
jgi:hypothetical protein